MNFRTRQSLYVKRNIEVCSFNHCCSGKSNEYCILWVCVCSLRNPACNAHAPYCHLWSVRLYHIFPHYLIKGTIFGNKFLNINSVFWFSLQVPPEKFLILRRTERDMIINTQDVSRLVDITARGDFLGLCYEKSSYKHVSDFGRLRSYDRLKLRIEGKDYWQ